MCNGNTGMIIEFLVFGGGGLLVLLGFIIKDLIAKKKAERGRAEERARQDNQRKRIETLKNKIKEREGLCAIIERKALDLYGEIEKSPYSDHYVGIRVEKIGVNIRGDKWRFDEHGLSNLKKENAENFCLAILQLMREKVWEEDSSLRLSISAYLFETYCSGSLSYKGKPIERSW